MMRDDVRDGLKWLGDTVSALAPDDGRKHTLVLSEQGRGDQARAIALCHAIRAAHPDAHVTLLGHYDGTMAKRDMAWHAHECGRLDAYIEAPVVGDRVKQRMTRGQLLGCLLPLADVLYDAMPVVPRVYYRGDTAAQVASDLRLGPYMDIYNGYPFECWRLKYVGLSWAELMTQTTGLRIEPDDLAYATPTELAPWPEPEELPPGASLDALKANSGSDDEAAAAITEKRPYVVVHAGAGGDATNKVLPKKVADAIIDRLERDGFPCVQVGIQGEKALRTEWKRLGIRLPLTNRLIRGAVCLVDNEGFLAYMAQGMGTPAAVLFSTTPYEVYGLPGNLNVIPGYSKWTKDDAPDRVLIGHPRRCPMGTCFWGGQWTWGENWAAECRLPVGPIPYDPPRDCKCLNFPRPEDAAALVAQWVKDR